MQWWKIIYNLFPIYRTNNSMQEIVSNKVKFISARSENKIKKNRKCNWILDISSKEIDFDYKSKGQFRWELKSCVSFFFC